MLAPGGGKQKGSRRERQSRDLFLGLGAIVQKAGGSLGAVDLIAFWPETGEGFLPQVKSNTFPRRAEMAALGALARRCEAGGNKWKVVIHRWDDRKGLRVFEVTGTGERVERPALLHCPDAKCNFTVLFVDSADGKRLARQLYENHNATTGHFEGIPFDYVWEGAVAEKRA